MMRAFLIPAAFNTALVLTAIGSSVASAQQPTRTRPWAFGVGASAMEITSTDGWVGGPEVTVARALGNRVGLEGRLHAIVASHRGENPGGGGLEILFDVQATATTSAIRFDLFAGPGIIVLTDHEGIGAAYGTAGGRFSFPLASNIRLYARGGFLMADFGEAAAHPVFGLGIRTSL